MSQYNLPEGVLNLTSHRLRGETLFHESVIMKVVS